MWRTRRLREVSVWWVRHYRRVVVEEEGHPQPEERARDQEEPRRETGSSAGWERRGERSRWWVDEETKRQRM
jgi:hypothetical protein